MKIRIMDGDCPNMPWEDRPEYCDRPLWRYSRNPIIAKLAVLGGNGVFDSAVVPFGDGFAGGAFGYIDEIISYIKSN